LTQLSQKTIDIVTRVMEVGRPFNIDVFIIDKDGIRARCSDKYIFLVQLEEYDFLEFESMCVSRITDFRNRLNFMTKLGKDFDMNIIDSKTLDSGDTVVRKMQMKSGKTSVEITGDNGSKYKLPKSINEPALVNFTITNESIEVLHGFPRAVQHKNKALNISGVSGIIAASTNDIEGDFANHILSTTPDFMTEGKLPRDFSFVYDITNLIPMMRGKLNIDISLTERGIMTTEIDEITVIIFPEKLVNKG
jgi:hypothetical protein